MAAAQGRVARGGHRHAERPEQVVRDPDRELGERDGLLPDRVDAGILDHREGVLHREHSHDRRGARQEPTHAVGGPVLGTHREDVGGAHPALDGLREPRLMPRRDVRERGRTGSAVEVLVRAADREVESPLVGLDRHGAGGVAEVPQDERAGVVGDAGQGCGIREKAGPVGDVAQHDHGRLGADRALQRFTGDAGGQVDVDPADPPAALAGDALDEVPVGGEVVAVDDDLDSGRIRGVLRIEGGADELVEQHRRRVRDDRLAGCGADRRAPDRVADRERQLHPALVPAADEASTPLVLHERREAVETRPRRTTERVAVEVDERRLRADERVAEFAERVGGVECGGLGRQRRGRVSGRHARAPRPGRRSRRRARRAARPGFRGRRPGTNVATADESTEPGHGSLRASISAAPRTPTASSASSSRTFTPTG